jgi:hypothetical protein
MKAIFASALLVVGRLCSICAIRYAPQLPLSFGPKSPAPRKI